MRRFRFRAERLLRLRRQQLQAEQMSLGAALQQRDAAQASWRQAQRAANAAEAAVRELLAASTASGDALRHRLELVGEAGRRLAFHRERCRQAEEQLQQQRQRVVEARRGVRVLERWRERSLARYLQQVAQQEARELDDLGAAAFVRARPPSAEGRV